MPAVATLARTAPKAAPAGASSPSRTAALRRLALRTGGGAPLPPTVRLRVESALGTSLGDVRVHAGAEGGSLVDAAGARAITYGRDIFLGSRERADDVSLLAHEAAHVVQQRRAAVPQAAGAGGGALEAEADRAAVAVAQGRTASVSLSTGGPVAQAETGDGPIESIAYGLLERFAPQLVPIVRRGPLGWLREQIEGAVDRVFERVTAPIRVFANVGATLAGAFGRLMAWMGEAAGRIARNDCRPITEAAERLHQVFEQVTGPAIERLRAMADGVRGFFTGLWDRFGAPVWDFLRDAAGAAWQRIQELGQALWDRTAPLREGLGLAWAWLRRQLGIDGGEGREGIFGWVRRKAGEVWDQHVRPFIERHRRPLMAVGGILLLVSPAGPLVMMGAAAAGAMTAIRWIRQNLSRPGAVVQNRGFLEGTLFPLLLRAIDAVSAFFIDKANFIAGRLGEVAAALANAAGGMAGSVFRFAAGAIQWLAARFQDLVQWARAQLVGLALRVRDALMALRRFVQPVIDFLGRIARTARNVLRIYYEIGARVWNLIPACIRDPFIDFLIPLILRQVSLFAELVASPEAWAQTRNDVMALIRQVFRDFDLVGAMRSTFRLLLRALRVPVALAVTVWQKAQTAWDAVLARPLEFIRNILRAVFEGFRRFFGNVLSHLGFGIAGWLFGAVASMGITPPSSWTDLRALFGLLLQILGITLDHILERLARRIGQPAVQRIRAVLRALSGAWEWVRVAIDEGPAGLWRMLVERLAGLGQMVIQTAMTWIMTRVVSVVSARLLSMLDPTGIMAVVNALVSLYQAIQTVIEYARQILEMVNRVLDFTIDIARAAIGGAAAAFEDLMRRSLPVIIGFLAGQAGLGGITRRIRDVIAGIRTRVDAAIDWIIDRAVRAGLAIIGAARAVAGRILQWWRKRFGFRTQDGQSHAIFTEGEPPDVRVVVQSNRSYLDEVVARIPDAAPQKAPARTLKDDIERTIRALDRAGARGRVRGGELTPRDEAEITRLSGVLDTQLQSMANLLAAAGLAGAIPTELPRPRFDFEMRDGVAHGATVEDLSANRPMGSEPYQQPLGWDYLQDEGMTTAGPPYFRRMHLVNHRLGGPGQNSNLVPGSQAMNSDHESRIEHPIKQLVGDTPMQTGKRAVVWMRVDVDYQSDALLRPAAGGRAEIRRRLFVNQIRVRWKSKPTPDGTWGPIQTPAPIRRLASHPL